MRDVGELGNLGVLDELHGARQVRAGCATCDAVREAALRGGERGGGEDDNAEELGGEHGNAECSQEQGCVDSRTCQDEGSLAVIGHPGRLLYALQDEKAQAVQRRHMHRSLGKQ